MILTVAIPTYNRPEKVKNTLLKLIPQVNANVQILILDNCSDVNIKNYLEETINEANLKNINIVRHRINIGADANFARMFELCDTPFIWTLGDDDKVLENAVELILQEIENYKSYDIIGFNFNSNCNLVERTKPILLTNTKELSENLDFFGNWLFLSTSVYKTEAYLKNLRYLIWGAYSMSSQLIPAMIAISQHQVFVLSEKYIVENVPLEDFNEKWSDINMSLSLTMLLESPVGFKKDEYKSLGKKFIQQFLLFPDVLYRTLKSVNYEINLIDNYHIYLYKQIFYRTFEFRDNKAKQFIYYQVCLFLLKNKLILKLLWRFVPYLRNKAQTAIRYDLAKR